MDSKERHRRNPKTSEDCYQRNANGQQKVVKRQHKSGDYSEFVCEKTSPRTCSFLIGQYYWAKCELRLQRIDSNTQRVNGCGCADGKICGIVYIEKIEAIFIDIYNLYLHDRYLKLYKILLEKISRGCNKMLYSKALLTTVINSCDEQYWVTCE